MRHHTKNKNPHSSQNTTQSPHNTQKPRRGAYRTIIMEHDQ